MQLLGMVSPLLEDSKVKDATSIEKEGNSRLLCDDIPWGGACSLPATKGQFRDAVSVATKSSFLAGRGSAVARECSP